MSWVEMGAVVLAGVWAGAINTLVGSGTLVTFPVLLAIGTPAVTANVSNSIGLVAGGVSGTIGYLPELKGMGRRVLQLVPMSVLGAITGALLLLWLPPEAFEA
ncbi:TSUP family transporter, partial [Janibacter hoylei]